jgi:predicted ATPase/DNA-binding winged helix-turn-helix (wHTH) protein
MQFQVLGPVRVVRPNGDDATPRGQRVVDLLTALLLRRRQPVDPLVLLDLVWGDAAVGLDISAVHTVVARLRRTVGSEAVATTPRGYLLNGKGTVDDEAFADLVAAARRASDPATAAEAYGAALALWRTGVAYDEANETLVAAERGRLAELRDSAREGLAVALLETGAAVDVEQALEVAQDLVATDPLRESSHELLMVGYARLGRHADALAAYRGLGTLLRDELGIDPGPQAEALHARLLARDPGLGAVRLQATETVRRPAPPAPTTTLVGREVELRELHGALDDRRLVTLTGPGGVGKSRLLAEAYFARPDRRAAAFVDLSALSSPDVDDLCDAIGRAFGTVLPDGQDQIEHLADALVDIDATLFIDEAERSVGPTAHVLGRLLHRCPGLRIVVTSRRALDLVGEHRLVLGPLACPEPDARAEVARAAPAVRLLQDRFSDRAPDLELTDDDVALLARLAQHVDGLPLALELVARSAETRSLADLEVELREVPFASLNLIGEAHRPERHRSLRDTVLWSASRLPDDQRAVLRRLGVFVGHFDAAAATAVVGAGVADVRAALRALSRDALVQMTRDSQGLRMRLLRTVRDLALEGLEETGELAEARARHRRWYADRWRGAPRSDDLIADVRESYDDYVEALRTALEDRDRSATAALTIAVGRLWLFTDLIGPGKRWLDRVLASDLLTDVECAQVRTVRAVLTLHQDPDAALADLEAALPALDADGDSPWLVTIQTNLALQHLARREAGDALVAARAAVAHAMAISPDRRADALSVLALVESVHDPTAAPETVRSAWLAAVDTGSVVGMETVANNLFLAQVQLGELEAAGALLDTVTARVAPSEVPVFLLLAQGWRDLQRKAPAEALDKFVRVAASRLDSPADGLALETYIGAGCALATMDGPAAVEVLSGASELLTRVRLALVPWQRQALAEALAMVGGPRAEAVPETTRALGLRLSERVRASSPGPV